MPPDPHISSCTQRRASDNNGSTPPAEPPRPVNPVSIVQRASLLALYIIHYTLYFLLVSFACYKTIYILLCSGGGGERGLDVLGGRECVVSYLFIILFNSKL